MKVLDQFNRWFPTPRLTRTRMVFAVGVAVGADALQWGLAPLALAGFFLDEVVDVIAMVVIVRTIGFHMLLLPTFALEFIPLAGMLPTWTGCTIAVIALRKNQQQGSGPPPSGRAEHAPAKDAEVIDV